MMTDKVNIEVEAPIDGRLLKVLAQDGDILAVGTTLAILAEISGSSSEHALSVNTPLHQSCPWPVRPPPNARPRCLALTCTTVVSAGASLPLNRNDVIAFVARASQASKRRYTICTTELHATPVAQKIAREHQLDLAARKRSASPVKR